jgi:hypothetical protein
MVPVSSTKQKPSGMTNMDLTEQDMPMDRGLHSIGPTVEPTPMGSYCTLAERRRLEERNAELHRQLSKACKDRDEALKWADSYQRAIDTIANRIGAYKRQAHEAKMAIDDVRKEKAEADQTIEFLRKQLKQREDASSKDYQIDYRIVQLQKEVKQLKEGETSLQERLTTAEDNIAEMMVRTSPLVRLGGQQPTVHYNVGGEQPPAPHSHFRMLEESVKRGADYSGTPVLREGVTGVVTSRGD